MRRSMRMAVSWTAVLSMCAAGMARAQTEPTPSSGPGHWTVDSAQTVGAGANVFAGAVGFPGVDLRLFHGLDSKTDVNGHIGINYGFEGLTEGTRFEFTAQVGIRRELVTFGGNLKLAGRFDPGIIVAASPGQFG